MEVKAPQLPCFRKTAIWHPQSGLIFSPYTHNLPTKVTWNPTSTDLEHLLSARLLEDSLVYLAFYPRENWDDGALFSTLAPPNLSTLIVEIPGFTPDSPRFILRDDVCQGWAELENFLLDVGHHLYTEHQDRQYLPNVDYPAWPYQCGYRHAHDSRVGAFTSLKRTQHAFRLLSAFVSFTLSLWVTQFENDCFDKPFESLTSRAVDPIPPVNLDYLKDSAVCRITPGYRPGGFLNPYTTKWGRVTYRFCRFCVPFWFILGHEQMYKTISPLDRSIKGEFLPPDDYIEKVKMRQATFSWLVLPDSNCFGPAPAQPNLPAPPSDSSFDHPLPDYAVLNDDIDPVNNTGPIPNQTVD